MKAVNYVVWDLLFTLIGSMVGFGSGVLMGYLIWGIK
jgi:hypothetical protein